MIDRALRALGVQPQPFRALVRAYLALVLRGQFYGEATNVKASELISPLYWVVGQFLTVSLLLCAVLQARVDAGFYAFANLSTTALLLFAAVIVELREVAFDPVDVEVVGHRPVAARTWSLARLTNLASFAFVLTISLTIFPTLMGVGQPDAGLSWLVLYPLASLLTGASAVGVALWISVSSIAGSLDPLRRVAAWVQILAILVLFYGGQLMLRDATGSVELFSLHPPGWATYLPTFALGAAVADADAAPLALAAAVALAIGVTSLARLAGAWAQVTQVRPERRVVVVRSAELAGPLARALSRTRRAAAVHALVRKTIARDGELRTRLFVSLALPVSAAALGVATGQYADPRGGASGETVLPIATTVLLAAAIAQVLEHLRTSVDHAASFHFARGWGAAERAGARSAVMVVLVLPVWLAHSALLAVTWRDPAGVIVFAVIGWLVLDLVARLVARTTLEGPVLSAPPRAFASFGGEGAIVAAGAGALASVIGAAWALCAPSSIGLAGLGVALVAASVAATARERAR